MDEPSLHPRRRVLRLLGALPALFAVKRAAAQTRLATRAIPASGELLPVVGLGTWQTFDVGASAAERAPQREVRARFAAAGARVIDSSPMYGSSESVLGDLAAELGVRDRLFLATKVWTRGREEGVRQMEESLRRMRVARLDLMQVHNLADVETHSRTLAEWQAQGRVRYLGITHYSSSAYAEIERLLATRRWDFVQINYSLAEREAERRVLPAARDRGVAVLVNRPFAEGALFRRVRGRALPEWAKEAGIASWAQYFLKWIVGHPAVTCAIPGTAKPDHLSDNLGAALGTPPDAALRRRMAAHYDSL